MRKKSPIIPELIVFYSENGMFEKMINFSFQHYNVRPYDIKKFSPAQIQAMYTVIVKKNYNPQQKSSEYFWFENQLKVFVWTLLAYSFREDKNIAELGEPEWQIFAHTFNNRPSQFFQFQANFILKQNKFAKNWAHQQTQILKSIITQRGIDKKWNYIARQLFNLSNKIYFKTPKQCRERWLNHLDPSKKHTKWAPQQDLKMFKLVNSKGKKWAQISKLFQNTRTEHMIKNRYKAIFNLYLKKYKNIEESDLVQKFIQTKGNLNLKIPARSQKVKQKPLTSQIRRSQRRRLKKKEISFKKKFESKQCRTTRLNISVENQAKQLENKNSLNQFDDLVVNRTKGSQLNVINVHQSTNLPFFQQIDSDVQSIPFMVDNENFQSFISQCMQNSRANFFTQFSNDLQIQN